MQAFFRRIGFVLMASLAALGFLMLDDPVRWSRLAGLYIGMFSQSERPLTPTEIVEGPKDFEIPTAAASELTVAQDALDEAILYAEEFDSFALVVVHRGRIQTEWYAPGWDREKLTQSQSMHKTFTAMLVGAALQEKLIGSIDDEIGRYLPDWRDDPRGRITIRQLMQMSSGLANPAFSLNPMSDNFGWLHGSDIVPIIMRTPLADWPPGTRFDYNNINSEILGLVLQQATGKRYARYLSEKIWGPIGAGNGRVWLDRKGGQAHTSCCFYARPRDWAKVGMMLANGGVINNRRILPEDWIEQMIEPDPISSGWYGLQIWLGANDRPHPPVPEAGDQVTADPFDERDTFYLFGRGGQFIYVVPSEDLVVVRMGRSMSRTSMPPGYRVSYLVNTILRGMPHRIGATDDLPADAGAIEPMPEPETESEVLPPDMQDENRLPRPKPDEI